MQNRDLRPDLRREERHCCEEYAELSRRQLLRRGAALATAPAWLPRVALAQNPVRLSRAPRDTLVSVFLRGGHDGLTAVPPYGDQDYYVARPTIGIPPPGQPNGAVDLDGFFGLAPAAAPLLTPYSNGHLLIAHAAGSPDPTLSHFDGQRWMELGIPLQGSTSAIGTGWLARHLIETLPLSTGDLRAVAVSNILPDTLAGAPATLPIADPATFAFPGRAVTEPLRRMTIEGMYERATEPLGSAAVASLRTVDLLAEIDFGAYVPSNGAVYPDTDFGRALASIAAMTKAGIGLETAHVDFGGWDHHNMQGPVTGTMALLLDDFTRSVEAFYLDMLGEIERVVLVAMSEFGRRIAENGSLGADHGHGGVLYVLGGHVAGGQVLTSWPGLVAPGNGNLAITTDYRDLLAEILEKRLGNRNLAAVFPNYTPTFQGIVV